jgi:ABC-type maltose transport system permease subunit
MHTAQSQVTPDARPASAGRAQRPRKRRLTRRKVGASAVKHVVLIVLSAMFGLPLLWMVLTSFKTAAQALTLPVVWWPHPILVSNYPQLFAALPFFRFFLNTFVYAGVTIVGVCLSSSLVAYGFSRLRWPGRDAVFYVMLMTLILPFVCTLIPAPGGADILRQLRFQHVLAPPVLYDDTAVIVRCGTNRRSQRILYIPADYLAAG